MYKIVFASLLAITTLNCTPKCKTGTMRCVGTAVNLCRPDGKWQHVLDCNKLQRTEKTFYCYCRNDNKCGCLAEVCK